MADDFTIKWHDKAFMQRVNFVSLQAMTKACISVQAKAKELTGEAGTGSNVYKRTKTGKMHRASAPGQPPARDTGILTNSIAYEVKKSFGLTVEGFVGPDIDYIKKELTATGKRAMPKYAFFLEVGTKNMAARPYLRPALRKSQDKIMKIFRNAVK